MNFSDALLHSKELKEMQDNPRKKLEVFSKSIKLSVALYIFFITVQFFMASYVYFTFGRYALLVMIIYNLLSSITRSHWRNIFKIKKLWEIAEKMAIEQEKNEN